MAGDAFDVSQIIGGNITRFLQLLDHIQNKFRIVLGGFNDESRHPFAI
jgi:hypothetical protein